MRLIGGLAFTFLLAGNAAMAQTTTAYKPLSDPYAKQEVKSGATNAPPELKSATPDAAKAAPAKTDHRDPAMSGADGKASFSRPQTNTTDDSAR